MTVKICDICHPADDKGGITNDDKINLSKYRISLKEGGRQNRRIALDTCEKHKNYFKDKKGQTFDQTYNTVNKDIYGIG